MDLDYSYTPGRGIGEQLRRYLPDRPSTCFSGKSDGGFLFNNISPIVIDTRTAVPRLDRVAIFSSSLNNQVSTWFRDKRHGLFTYYYFIKGIIGGADENVDKKVTTTELQRYLSQKVPSKARRLNGNEQTPMLVQKKEFVLVDYNIKYDKLSDTKYAHH